MNDGSTDATVSIVEAWSDRDKRISLIHQNNQGVSRARNAGFQASMADSLYVLFLDSDDCLYPSMLSKMTEFMDMHPDIGLVRCEYEFIDHAEVPIISIEQKPRYVPTRFWVRKLSRTDKEIPFVSIFALSGIVPSVALIRRTVYAMSGGFDETFGQYHEDTDLFLRLRLLSDFYYFPEVLVTKRIHDQQCTANNDRFKEIASLKEKRLCWKWASCQGLTRDQKNTVRRALYFKQSRLEAYLSFRRSFACFGQGNLLPAFRFFIGALRRYFVSLIYN